MCRVFSLLPVKFRSADMDSPSHVVLLQEADVLVVGEIVVVEGEVIDVGQVHDPGGEVGEGVLGVGDHVREVPRGVGLQHQRVQVLQNFVLFLGGVAASAKRKETD